MLNTVYRLVAPRRFEVEFNQIHIKNHNVIVRPTYLSICNADQRYYQGRRATVVMQEKLPMALIHEGIGEVIYDAGHHFHSGEHVVMIPNIPMEKDEVTAENYLPSSKFRASGYDGFMQDLISISPEQLVVLPKGIKKETAAFTEIVTVGVHTISRFDLTAHARRHKVGIWGDGSLGYITAVLMKAMFPDIKIYVFGLDWNNLSRFSFADETYRIMDIPKDLVIDHAFECVGGEGAPKAINQIIEYIRPEGTIAIMGVSENPVPIDTRMILEKGLRLFGSSRSGRKDFEKT
ncbi:MAG: zinc-binding dehydrogenase, partial [Lachnoclostridium sp.]|nr:zinc-binding dehydrogenase [Lachnoclostridium sp.]